MKKLSLSLLLMLFTTVLISSCKKEKDDEQQEETSTNLTGVLSADKTLSADKIWTIEGRFVVPEGKTLTIEQGTIIKGKPGTGADASVLIIARGGKIMANGTETNPIIFTAEADNITKGQKYGTNLGPNDTGLWGGILILGKAKGSFDGDVSEFQIEGIPASDTNGLYGGNDDADNSGVFKYVSIRHGGAEIGAGNEINGLSLGAVGSATVLDHIEIVANSDDGIEHFGGDPHLTNVLVYSCSDDGLDIDQAFHGTIENAVVIEGDNSDHALEIDGGEGSYEAGFTLHNITLIGNQNTPKGEYADLRDGAMGTLNDIYAYGFKDDSDVELDDDDTATHYNAGSLVFGTWQIVLPAGVTDVTSLFKNTSNVTVSGFGSTAQAVQQGQQTVGADMNQFDWTFAKHNNAF